MKPNVSWPGRWRAGLGLALLLSLTLALPLLRPDVLFDPALFRLETTLHLGVNPGRFLQGLFPYPVLWRALDGYYAAFILTVMGGLGWFAATLSIRDRARFAAGTTNAARPCAVRSNCRAMFPQTRSHSA